MPDPGTIGIVVLQLYGVWAGAGLLGTLALFHYSHRPIKHTIPEPRTSRVVGLPGEKGRAR